jgi:hypothetical protein
VLRAKESFAVQDDRGYVRIVAAGDVVDSSDNVVRGRESLFEPAEDTITRRADFVEQATAAPGEKRTVSRRGPRRAKED